MQAGLFASMNHIDQLDLGSGTSAYLSDVQMEDLMQHLRHAFHFAPDTRGVYAIEVDSRFVSCSQVVRLRQQGFNCITLRIQDDGPAVRKAINPIQLEHQTQAIVKAAHEAGFRSVSVNLIYGLPRQTLAAMMTTLGRVITANPDRIVFQNSAQLPHQYRTHHRIAKVDSFDPVKRMVMQKTWFDALSAAGYACIGVDHFAKPGDELAIAQRHGRLHRNVLGYSAHQHSDLVSMGISAISAVAATYSQNVKTLKAYYDALDRNRLPVVRGVRLSMDDAVRRTIIQTLMCQCELSTSAIEVAYPIVFKDFFAAELSALRLLERAGLVTMKPDWISVTPRGRLLIRTVCLVFDRYLAKPKGDRAHGIHD